MRIDLITNLKTVAVNTAKSIDNKMNITRIRALSELPNTVDFEFVGIRKDGTHAECYVKKNAQTGTYEIAGDAKFENLLGWIPACK